MATLKANGGVYRYFDKARTDGTSSRFALCQNGRVLRKIGDRWTRAGNIKPGKTLADAVADFERNGYVADTSSAAIGMVCRTRSEAICHRRGIEARRVARNARP